MATTYANIRMHKKVGNDDLIMYPQTLDTNILVDTSNPSIPSSVNNIYDLVEGLGGLAFEDNLAVNVDTETEYAVLRITDDPTQSDSDLVASAAAVNAVNNSTVKLDTDQEVGGHKPGTDTGLVEDADQSVNTVAGTGAGRSSPSSLLICINNPGFFGVLY